MNIAEKFSSLVIAARNYTDLEAGETLHELDLLLLAGD